MTAWAACFATSAFGVSPAAAISQTERPAVDSPAGDPLLFARRLRSAVTLLGEGKTADAVELLEEAVLYQPSHAGTRRLLGVAYAREGRFRQALDQYDAALGLTPFNEELYLEVVDLYILAGLPEDAAAVLDRTAATFPDSASGRYQRIRYELADLYAGRGRLGRAVEEMERAALETGEVGRDVLYERLGDFYADLARVADAAAAYQEALEVNPDRTDARLGLAEQYARLDRLAEAAAEYRQVVESHPALSAAYDGLAETYLGLDRFEEAAGVAERAIRMRPDDRRARYIRGRALLRMGRAEEGGRELEAYRVLEAAAQAADYRLREIHSFKTGALAQLVRGRYDEAIEILQRGVAAYPDAADLRFNLALAESQAGRHAEAVATFRFLLERDMGDPTVILRQLEREYRTLEGIDQ